MRYHRNIIPGGSYFFTVVTEQRRPILQGEETLSVLREAFRKVRDKHPFTIDAIAVLPDHLHCIWSMPPEDGDFPLRWRLIKSLFTKHCHIDSAYRAGKRGERELWQRRYWEHTLRDDSDFSSHVDYIHFNPVKHGYVGSAGDWPYSSFSRYVKDGTYSPDWGSGEKDFDGVGQE